MSEPSRPEAPRPLFPVAGVRSRSTRLLRRLQPIDWFGRTRRDRLKIWILLITGCVGLASRFWLAKNSIGCNDTDIWLEHARTISAHGVDFAYRHPELESNQYNHPPLMGLLSNLALYCSGPDELHFSWWIKAPGLLAELLAAYLVWRVGLKRSALSAAWAFAAYGLSLTQIAVSGYHGNTDCAYAGLTLLSFYLMKEKRAPFLSGLALAAALNVKILPVLMVPPLLAQCRSWRALLRFSLGASIAILPFAPFLLHSFGSVYHNVIAYNSQQLDWGFYALVSYASGQPLVADNLDSFVALFIRSGRYLIMVAIAALSLYSFFKARRFAYHVGAAAWAIFLVLTPGYGVQYSVCVVPLLFVADVRRAALYSTLAGLMLVFIYTANMTFVMPFHADVRYYPFPMISIALGFLAWAVLVTYLAVTLKRLVADRTLGDRSA